VIPALCVARDKACLERGMCVSLDLPLSVNHGRVPTAVQLYGQALSRLGAMRHLRSWLLEHWSMRVSYIVQGMCYETYCMRLKGALSRLISELRLSKIYSTVNYYAASGQRMLASN